MNYSNFFLFLLFSFSLCAFVLMTCCSDSILLMLKMRVVMTPEEAQRTQKPYRYGMILLCFGALINWIGLAENYTDPFRYAGVACIIGGAFLICTAMCCWLHVPNRSAVGVSEVIKIHNNHLIFMTISFPLIFLSSSSSSSSLPPRWLLLYVHKKTTNKRITTIDYAVLVFFNGHSLFNTTIIAQAHEIFAPTVRYNSSMSLEILY